MIYVYSPHLDDTGPQAYHVVHIAIYLGNLDAAEATLGGIMNRVALHAPVRIVSHHQCLLESSSLIFRTLLRLYFLQTEDAQCARLQIHTGSMTECLYQLMSFGIPARSIPVNEAGDAITTKAHHEIMQRMRIAEELQDQQLKIISLPLPSDILFGKGKQNFQHTGNLRLNMIVDQYVEEYHSLKERHKKTELATKIVAIAKNASARFLSKDERGVWL